MDSNTEGAAVALVIAIVSKRKKKDSKRKERSSSVKSWLQRRAQLGAYDSLLNEFLLEEEKEYRKYLRISPETFDELLELVSADIKKQGTVMRSSIPPKIKLAAKIRFLWTGASYADLQYQFRLHKSTLTSIIPEICEAIYNKL